MSSAVLVALTLGCACGGARQNQARTPDETGGPPARIAADQGDRPGPVEAVTPVHSVRDERRSTTPAREIRARVGEAIRDCRASPDAAVSTDVAAVQRCVCEHLARQAFATSAAALTLRWPLPTTKSGSTVAEHGIHLVPLGPVFEVAIDASGAVTRCGVVPRGGSLRNGALGVTVGGGHHLHLGGVQWPKARSNKTRRTKQS